MVTRVIDLEKRLWDAADQLRANSNLSGQEYSAPVLGLIFLRYADYKFTRAVETLSTAPQQSHRRGANLKLACQAMGVLYVPEEARFPNLVALPEGEDVGKAINDAMRAIERENPVLKDVLPKTYNRLSNSALATLLKRLNFPEIEIEEDLFGRIYEYFLGQFAMGEGRRGGEFFTPSSIVRLIVEIIEPYNGRILDPACGSGGMFVQSQRFVEEHQVPGTSEVPGTSPGTSPGILSIYGQEKTSQTVRLCQMNLAVHGLEGNIKQTNSYYEDPHNLVGKFDYVMANPPFNVNGVNMEDLKGNRRFPLGVPSVDNANYLWIQLFYAALNESGRAGFVMANSASDARHSEQEIRRKLIAEEKAVDVMVAVGSNFFYTVTLPCTLWFLDKGKRKVPGTSEVPGTLVAEVPGTSRTADTVLFIDARKFYRQVSRAVRDFTDEQLHFLADIARLYRGEAVEMGDRPIPLEHGWGEATLMRELFPDGVYADVPGLCKVATIAEIEQQGWSLNPGRYVGVADRVPEDFDFLEQLEGMNEELELLNGEARKLEEIIAGNVASLLGRE